MTIIDTELTPKFTTSAKKLKSLRYDYVPYTVVYTPTTVITQLPTCFPKELN